MARYSVKVHDAVEEGLQRVRGQLMASQGKDVDKTRAFNIFLTLGILRFMEASTKGNLTESEQKIINLFTSSAGDVEYDSMMDEFGTYMLKVFERYRRKTPAKTIEEPP